MDAQAIQITKAATDLSRIQTQRIDDIMQLKAVIKLHSKNKSGRTAYISQSVIGLCKHEQDRRA